MREDQARAATADRMRQPHSSSGWCWVVPRRRSSPAGSCLCPSCSGRHGRATAAQALALLLGLPLALGVLLICNPPWWTEPLAGVLRFFDSNLSRGQTIPIPVQFLGLVYLTPRESLPWYNTLVWTVLVTPVGLLLLAILGTLRGLRQRQTDRIGVLVVANWVLLIVLRALPHTPGHDGVRLFLPAFGVLSFLVAMGARQAIDALGGRARMLVAAAMAEAVASVCLFMPVPLSYFSPLACGLPGAVRLGMEPTYYWDALDARARQWLREQTHPGETVRFASFPTSWLYLRQVGELPHRLEPLDRGLPAWYVLQNRPGAWSAMDRWLVEHASPAYAVPKFGVPLVWIFAMTEYAKAERESGLPALSR